MAIKAWTSRVLHVKGKCIIMTLASGKLIPITDSDGSTPAIFLDISTLTSTCVVRLTCRSPTRNSLGRQTLSSKKVATRMLYLKKPRHECVHLRLLETVLAHPCLTVHDSLTTEQALGKNCTHLESIICGSSRLALLLCAWLRL